MRDMFDMQARIHEWAETVFGSASHIAPLYRRVLDELGELDEEMEMNMGLTVGEVRENPAAVKHIKDECADVVITLFRLAGSLGFDLLEEVGRKQSINEGRRWRSHGDGTGKHIKNEDV